MELTEYERLNLMNQYEILAKLTDDEHDKKHYLRNVEILSSGYEYLYSDLTRMETGNGTLTREEAKEVLNILHMFQMIGYAVDDGVDTEGIDDHALEFPGFDGNHESKYLGFADFYCEGGERFARVVAGRNDLNSHAPLLPNMRRMLDAYNESADGNKLTHDDLVRITAARHP